MILVILALKIVGKSQKPQSPSSSTKELESEKVTCSLPWFPPLMVPTLLQKVALHSPTSHMEAEPDVSWGFHLPCLRCCPDAESWKPLLPPKIPWELSSLRAGQSLGAQAMRKPRTEPLSQASIARRALIGHAHQGGGNWGPEWARVVLGTCSPAAETEVDLPPLNPMLSSYWHHELHYIVLYAHRSVSVC